jgi:hypothetical protein
LARSRNEGASWPNTRSWHSRFVTASRPRDSSAR